MQCVVHCVKGQSDGIARIKDFKLFLFYSRSRGSVLLGAGVTALISSSRREGWAAVGFGVSVSWVSCSLCADLQALRAELKPWSFSKRVIR